MKTKHLYLVSVLSRALDVLELLQVENTPMTLESIHRHTNIPKTTIYRVLKTLIHRGYVSQSVDRCYRHVARPKKLCFGFGAQSANMPFSEAVTHSLREAALRLGIDLIVLDNRYDADTAKRNADAFIRERVDLIIEFQVDQAAAPIIAQKIRNARIPLIAVDIPHPNATYFGVDNYRVGYEAGEILAEFAIREWKSKMDWMVGLDLAVGGRMVQTRTTGAFEAVRGCLPGHSAESFVRIDGRGMREPSYEAILKFLKRYPDARRVLIAAHNDMSALGALGAARELGRERHVAIVGQDCVEEMMEEMQGPRSPVIASISHEVEQYGPRLIDLGLSLLRGDTVAPYNYAEYKAVKPDREWVLPETNGDMILRYVL